VQEIVIIIIIMSTKNIMIWKMAVVYPLQGFIKAPFCGGEGRGGFLHKLWKLPQEFLARSISSIKNPVIAVRRH